MVSTDFHSKSQGLEIHRESVESLPEPVGPIKSTLLFSSSTLSSSSIASKVPDSAPGLVLEYITSVFFHKSINCEIWDHFFKPIKNILNVAIQGNEIKHQSLSILWFNYFNSSIMRRQECNWKLTLSARRNGKSSYNGCRQPQKAPTT